MRMLLFVGFFLMAAGSAMAQQEELQAVLAAAEAYASTQGEIASLEEDRRAFRLEHGVNTGWSSSTRDDYTEMTAQLEGLKAQVRRQQIAHSRAAAGYRRVMAPYNSLLEEALRAHSSIAASTSPVQRMRALAAIERDLPRLGFPSKALSAASAVQTLIENGAPSTVITARIKEIAADDPAVGEFLGSAYGLVNEKLKEYPQLERVAAWTEALGKLGAGVRAYRALSGQSGGVFDETEIDRLAGLIDLVAELPGSDSLPLLDTYLGMLGMMLEDISKNVENIEIGISRGNLVNLVNYAASGDREDIQDSELTRPKGLFARLGANPKLYLDETAIMIGSAVSGGWSGAYNYDAGPWIGIYSLAGHPMDFPTNMDAYYTVYDNVGTDAGTFSYEGLNPGQYLVRLLDARQGNVVGEVALSIFDPGCTLYSVWDQYLDGRGGSRWAIDGTGRAMEDGLGNAIGAATLVGKKLTIAFDAPTGHSGTYSIQLDEHCTGGAGTMTLTRAPNDEPLVSLDTTFRRYTGYSPLQVWMSNNPEKPR